MEGQTRHEGQGRAGAEANNKKDEDGHDGGSSAERGEGCEKWVAPPRWKDRELKGDRSCLLMAVSAPDRGGDSSCLLGA